MTHQYIIHATNPSLTAGVREDVWDQGGMYPWQQAATAVRIKAGGNAADAAAGSGARLVRVFGLDANLLEVQEDIVPAGVAASAATTQQFLRITRVHVISSGTYGGANVGDIVIESSPGAVTLAAVLAGFGTDQMSNFTVPANARGAYLRQFQATVFSNKVADVELWFRSGADVVAAPFVSPQLIKRYLGVSDGLRDPGSDVFFPPGSDVWAAAVADSGGTGSSVAVHMELLVVE